jgi:hypothetical protein
MFYYSLNKLFFLLLDLLLLFNSHKQYYTILFPRHINPILNLCPLTLDVYEIANQLPQIRDLYA